MPRPAAMDAGSCAESVSRVPKLTSFSMFALNSLRGNLLQCRRDLRVGDDGRFRPDGLRRANQYLSHSIAASHRGPALEIMEMEHALTVSVQKNPIARARFPFLQKISRLQPVPLDQQPGRI